MQPRHYLVDALFSAIKENHDFNVRQLSRLIEESSKTDDLNQNKAHLDARNEDGQSFLHYALQCEAFDAFRLLLPFYVSKREFTLSQDKKRAVLLSQDKNGRSLFWWAVKSGRRDIAIQLFTSFYKPKPTDDAADEAVFTPAIASWMQPDNKGVTPLHVAASLSLLLLILNNLDKRDEPQNIVNLHDAKGDTPLHTVCREKRGPQHILALLLAGAATHLQNKKGESFLTYHAQDPTIFTIQDLKLELQLEIFAKHLQIVLANPDNEELKKFHEQLRLQMPLFIPRLPEMASISDRPYQLIHQDREFLSGCEESINALIETFNTRKNPGIPGYFTIATKFIFGSGVGGAILALLMFVVSFLPRLSPKYDRERELAEASVNGTQHIALIFAALSVFGLLAAAVSFGVGRYLTNIRDHAHLLERDEVLAEIRIVLDQLLALEKEDANLLPVDTQTIRSLEADMQSLEQEGLTNAAVPLLENIKTTLTAIENKLVETNKPLALAIESATLALEPAPSSDAMVVEIPVATAPQPVLREREKTEDLSLPRLAQTLFNTLTRKEMKEDMVYLEMAELSAPLLSDNKEDSSEEKVERVEL